VPVGGAHTHYAVDVVRGGVKVLRLVVVDSSLRSLAASDADQNPVEEQLKWLREVLQRPEGERAVVVSNTPTYSYGPGQGNETAIDGSALEAVLMAAKVDMVVSGRLGWNALYWAHAPGVHEPCPGSGYQEQPSASVPTCQSGGQGGVPDPDAAAAQVGEAIHGLGAPAPPTTSSVLSAAGVNLLPTVVASSAGGRLSDDTGSASQGYWHGYTVVRLSSDGKFAPIVEQRPVFDWIGIQAQEHTLGAGQHVTLKGYGREPVGTDVPIRYDDINTAAITHRYDLVQADPQRPYLPRTDCDGNPNGYCPLDPGVGTVDPQSGAVKAGRGNHGRVYAVAILSVGPKAASWPLSFEPRRSFRPPPPRAAQLLRALPLPPIQVAAAAAAAPASPAPPLPPPPPGVGSPSLPALPGLPGLPASGIAPPAPPPPPAPPAPPASPTAQPLQLALRVPGLQIAPATSVVPPPAPPIQPAPPGGARKEARQRQAAAAKSEEGSQKQSDAAGDLAGADSSPPSTNMTRLGSDPPHSFTRRERGRSTPSFTPQAHHAQPSAWTTGLEWGGGLTLMALALALGFTTLRPTPRRREPDLPAPAYVRARRRS
jgi:hypothetical protein